MSDMARTMIKDIIVITGQSFTFLWVPLLRYAARGTRNVLIVDCLGLDYIHHEMARYAWSETKSTFNFFLFYSFHKAGLNINKES